MLSVLCFFEVVLRSARNDLTLELQIFLQNFFERQGFRLAVYKRNLNDAVSDLQLCILEQMIEDNLRVRVALQIHNHAHTLAAGIVVDVGNALNTLILHEVGDAFNQPRLVDLIGKLGHDNRKPAVFLVFDNFRARAQGDFAAPRRVSGTDARSAHNDTRRGEVGSFDVLHQILDGCIGIVYQHIESVNNLSHIVRRNVCRHTDGNTRRAVDQQIRKTRRQNHRLFQTVVVVGHKIDGVFVDIGEHFHRNFAHSRFRITVSRRRVAVDRTEVAVPIHKHIAHREALRQAYHCVIHRRVAVRVITA